MNSDPTIFVVDDEQAIQEALQTLLESVGYQVKTYPSGEAFFEDYLPSRAGCLILDISMPNLSGTEIQSQLKGRGIRLPVIMISGQASVSMAVQAMKSGAVDVLEKPFADELLLQSVREALQLDKLHRNIQEEHSKIATRLAHLTSDEHKILELICDGATNREIASQMNLKTKVLKAHRARLIEKMGANSLAGLIKMSVIAKITS